MQRDAPNRSSLANDLQERNGAIHFVHGSSLVWMQPVFATLAYN